MDNKNIDVEVYLESIDKWKFDAMEIRGELIETREKLANLYLQIGNNEILEIMGDLHRAIDALKRL